MEKGVDTLAVSDGFCELFGYGDHAQAYARMDQKMFSSIHPDDAPGFTNALLRFGLDSERLDVHYRAKMEGSSHYKVIHMSGEHMISDDGLRLAQIWFADEGEYEEGDADPRHGICKAFLEKNLERATRYDFLTGLPNMSHFFELCEFGKKAMLEKGGKPALLYIDLSGMKSYNHKYGFSEGDKLLKYFAHLLSQHFRTENCCHINADRFAAFADETGLEAQLDHLFQAWEAAQVNMHLPICVGIYTNQMEDVPVGMAYDRAKIACDALKSVLTSSYKFYNDAMSDKLAKQQYVIENFDRALDEKWI